MPSVWRDCIEQNVAAYSALSQQQQKHLEDDTRVFVATKGWDAGRGVELSDEVKVTIAAQACLLLVGFAGEHDGFYNVKDVVVLATGYELTEFLGRGEREIVKALGHTKMYGPVYLAWDSVRHGGREPDDGRNLVYHEFAHKLDLTDGLADGTPTLDGRVDLKRWVDVMTAAYEQLCERAERGQPTLLDTYGCTNSAEFFAVATECFFEKPEAMAQRHTALYGVLKQYFRFDPASR